MNEASKNYNANIPEEEGTNIAIMELEIISELLDINKDLTNYEGKELSKTEGATLKRIKDIVNRCVKINEESKHKLSPIIQSKKQQYANEGTITLIRSIGWALKQFHETNNKYPEDLAAMTKVAFPRRGSLEEIFPAYLYDFSYSPVSIDEYELNLIPKQNFINKGEISKESYHFNNLNRKIIRTDSSGQVKETISIDN